MPILAGLGVLAVCLLVLALVPQPWRELLRERAFDLILTLDDALPRLRPAPVITPVIIVDIDRRSINALGAWPWSRETMARLVEAIAARRPTVIAIDVLFADPDTRSPAALARRLGALTGRAEFMTIAEELPDGDKRLAEALRLSPAVLGFVLDPDRRESVPAPPIVIRGAFPAHAVWRMAGATGPTAALAAVADGLGTLSLPGDADGLTRRVPLLVGAAGVLLPGMASEAVRVAGGASTYVIASDPPRLRAGKLEIELSDDAMLRLVPVRDEQWAARTVSALDVIEGRIEANRFEEAIAFIGGSAPELGGLRQTPSEPLIPSVRIHAHAVAQLLAGRTPRILDPARVIEPMTILGLGVVAVAAGASVPPLAGFTITLSAIALAWLASLGLVNLADRLFDPATPSLVAALAFVATSVASFAVTRRREMLVRRRFEQHLAPAVVRRIVERPDLLKLSGERREVTALFTDIEGFTAMTRRTDPQNLLAVLDAYFEGAASIVVEHGGMVDKIIGDAVHALFNAPIDLENHPQRAVDCAIALREWTHAYRRRAEPAAMGFGRTRIGIETGPAIVGDVGIRTKLDYTAHGDAINTAARLEAANKELGSTICVGPTAARRCDPDILRPLGTIEVRGRDDPLTVFEPWPADAPQVWRQRYMTAFRMVDGDPETATVLFADLAQERPEDPVPRRMAERLQSARDVRS